MQKTVLKVLKRAIFFYPAFCLAGQWGGYTSDYSAIQALNLVCIVRFRYTETRGGGK